MSLESETEQQEWESLNERQQELAKEYAESALEFGMFDQTSGADGAHYAPAAKNPFKADGLVCKNCIFYNEENAQCKIVSGKIEPEAICKLWIIPENQLAGNSKQDQVKKLLRQSGGDQKARQTQIDQLMSEID
jgi:hypothetical protein